MSSQSSQSSQAERSEPRAFDLIAEVPHGVTVLEASAGTGKTYTIAALATRFVAAGVPLDQMLLVTFTRMATGELRERVRERLIASERLLSAALAGTDPIGDELDRMLAGGTHDVVELRRWRLEKALSSFDAATIETTHSFCNEVLTELGTLGDLDPGVTLTESVDDILADVVDDLYVRRFLKTPGQPLVSRADAGEIADAAVANIDANLYPVKEPAERTAAMRWRLARAVRTELAERKRALGVITYDDLLGRLLGTLTGPNREDAVRMLRDRYSVVLIDEFQDTDPVQWKIVERAFGGGAARLVLIADPKQAIYAFRGADVFAYLSAARTASTRSTLATNYRSDACLLAGFDALFGGVRLGHPEIVYRQVSATPSHRGWRLRGAPSPGALRFRVLDRDHVALTPSGAAVDSGAAREAVAADVAADIVTLLEAGAEIEDRDRDGETTGTRPIGCGDIAVLVDKHKNADSVRQQLEAAGVPAVIGGAGSVFLTGAADDWLTLLEALERPSSSLRARTAALTPLVGWDATRLADADPAKSETLHRSLYRWSRIFAEDGLAAMTDTVMVDSDVAARLLQQVGGERLVTDLQHVAELLHRASVEEQLGLSALTAWLRQRIDAAETEGAHGDERTRRLDSDAAAVQVLTIHRAKGLEWPVVYCPYLWDRGRIPDEKRPVYFHRDGERAVDVTLEGSGYYANRKLHNAEERGEDLRLAYVALTRARHRTVVHWAGSWDARNSPLARLLFARQESGEIAVDGPEKTPQDSQVFAALEAVGARCSDPGAVTVEWARPAGLPASWSGSAGVSGALAAARFTRPVDTHWRRTSYSALTALAHDRRVDSAPETGGLDDEPDAEDAPLLGDGVGNGGAEGTEDLPLGQMAFGPAVGTLIHQVLDLSDFAAPKLVPELALRLVEAAGPRAAARLGCPVGQVATGLSAALSTPITGLGGLTLAGLTRGDRLDELTFELPLAGGDAPAAGVTVTLSDMAAVLRAFIPADSPLAGYPARLADPLVAGMLRGYLTGSIDLALRLPSPGGRPRFAIVDYKTNWLAPPGEPLRTVYYHPLALALEMQRTHYLLQGLLYSVALHRFLRWRVPGYDPDSDLAGIHYLFLRGMTGDADTGVFSWQLPAGLVPALSDLLDGERIEPA